jgi:hypothetical protein
MYILKPTDQEKLRQRLVLVETRDGGWTQIFRDLDTQTEWLLFRHHGELQGGGYPVMRELTTSETLADLLSKCLSSSDEDDVIGLAWELSTDYEKWSQVLDWLEVHATVLSKRAVRLFLNNLQVLHVMNRRSVIGKKPQEIEQDYQHFRHLAQRAGNIIQAG